MNITGWIVVGLIAGSAMLLLSWRQRRIRLMRRNHEVHVRRLNDQIELQQDSIEMLMDSRDRVMDALGTVMIVATSHTAVITSDDERREALASIARMCRQVTHASSRQKQ